MMTFEMELELLDVLSEAVLALDAGRVIGMNRACAELLQVDRDRAIGRTAIEVLRHHRLEQVALRGGEIELELSGRLIRARGVMNALVLEDITHQRQRERELKEVMSVLSHEFRTPVAAIKSLLEAMQLEMPEAQRQRFIEIATIEVERLVRLTEDLTVGFRPQTERTFALGEAFERVLRLLGSELVRREVKLRVTGEHVLVKCDPDKLVQVMLNLVENAMRHGPNPGTVQLEATRDTGPDNAFVTVRVHDDGATLTDYEALFEAHRRGEGSSGSGMGLYIVRSIVNAWGGRVWGQYNAQTHGNDFGFTVFAS
jgi:signal transduction histidine kinase